MDATTIVISTMIKEDRKFTPNNYDFFVSPSQQLTLSKLKTVGSRSLRAVSKLIETSGNFLKLRENVYRDLRQERLSIVALKAKEPSHRSKEVFLTQMQTLYPTSQFTLAVLHSSDEDANLICNGYQVRLVYGRLAFAFLFGDKAPDIIPKIQQEVREYFKGLGKEILDNQSDSSP